MTSFNVLSRNESIHRHLLLEASAGTGKTFAIENIVIRLLIEPKGIEVPLLIENILVVTFTRMAARELRERIHSNLEKCLDLLRRYSLGDSVVDQFPDYLWAHVELGDEAIHRARKYIERALFSFDRSQIFTIHGFCWRMLKNYSLEAGISLDSSSREDKSCSTIQLMQVVRDFLRRELDPSVFSKQQLKIIMRRAKNKSEKLQLDLVKIISRGMDIKSPPPFSYYLSLFCEKMKWLRQEFKIEGQKIIEDFLSLAPFYKELSDRNRQIYPEKMFKVERFAHLFDQNEWREEDLDILIEDGLFLLEALDPIQLKAKSKEKASIELNYSRLLSILKEQLEPLVTSVRSETTIFCRLASDCQKFVGSYQEQQEMLGHSDLLIQMKKAVENFEFANCVRNNYSAVIVDEFQDTDPIQWTIFSMLFASKDIWKGNLNLVGDPKQSIYAFRQADIYTYLSAAKTLGLDSLATLDTNFRSQLSLINALNILFEAAEEPFSLPKISKALPYRKVNVGRKENLEKICSEPSLLFWEVKNESKLKNPLTKLEEIYLLPAIAREILLFHEKEGKRFSQFAILIADRFQAGRVCEYLISLNIPVKNQKGKDIALSSVVDEMRDLLNGILNFHSTSHLNIALAGRLIGMTHCDLLLLENEENLLPIMENFNALKNIFYEFGFSSFYSNFMKSVWHSDGKSVLERLLNQTRGIEFYREWQDLADLMIDEEYVQNFSPQKVVSFLDELKSFSTNEDERIKAFIDPAEDCVSVLTTHMSKGLEFDIVFALGLIKRNKESEDLIPFEEKNKFILCPIENKNDPLYQKYCEENDAEKMRQLYVALTRAKDRLYIPVIINQHHNEVSKGCASPIELFLARLGQPLTNYQGLYDRISADDGSNLASFTAKFSTNMSLLHLEKGNEKPFAKKAETIFELISPKQIKIPGSIKLLQSFTSLAHSKSFGQQIVDEKFVFPHNFSLEEKTEHTLPSGSDTGVIIHQIFENLPFNTVKEKSSFEELIPDIKQFLIGTEFIVWQEVIAKIIFKTLTTNLINSNFCLADINPKKMFREKEFLYFCDDSINLFKETKIKSGYLKGVVDLFFEHQGKYYLLDWKSNWLGPSLKYYENKNLDEAMHANQYDLQAAIYQEAMRRYLKIFDQRPFEEIYGGVYYLFIRGLGPETGMVYLPNKIEMK